MANYALDSTAVEAATPQALADAIEAYLEGIDSTKTIYGITPAHSGSRFGAIITHTA